MFRVFLIPIPSTETKPLKSGWAYGVVALICGLQPFFALLLSVLSMETTDIGVIQWNGIVSNFLVLISPACAIVSVVFGVIGCNTQGRIFAYIGLLLSVPYLLLVLFVWCILFLLANSIYV